MQKTSICWTDSSWNPVTGCTQCSPECHHCYAKAMANRWFKAGNPRYANNFTVTLHPEALLEPFSFPKSEGNILCFVCSMADLFHEDVPFEFIDKIMTVIRNTPHITYQLLTKRDKRMAEYFSTRKVPANAWVGVTCGHKHSLHRVDTLRTIAAPVRFISVEPLLEDIATDLDLTGIDWVIVGGESGKDARQMQEDWAWNLKEFTDKAGVAFLFKQWGSLGCDGVRRSKQANGCLLKGAEYKAYPTPRVNF